jgi:uncharacterized protein YndB with AHSA1/START domain
MDAVSNVSVTDDGPMVRAVARLPGCSPDIALAAFTDAGVLNRWWASAELTADLVPRGRYTVRFAAIGKVMDGRVVGYEPGRYLEFSWAWTHAADDPPRTVTVTAISEGDGTLLTVVHGPHGDDERELAARGEHREGWEFFLPRLATVVSGS